jgi:hypothetical protein
MGRIIVGLGVALLIVGGAIWVGGRMGLGALPGDLKFGGQAQGWSCFVPITTSILISLLLTIVLNLVLRFFSK